MLITVFLEMKVEDLQRRRAPELLATKTRTENRPGDDAAPVLLGKNMAAEQQDLHNTEGQTRPSPELLPPHLLLVDDLPSGPLSSLNPSAPCWSTHPDPKQSLATPSVELLLSYNLFYLAGAAKVVADDVKDKSFRS